MLYCTASDVYQFGVPPGAVANPARLVASIDAGTDVITLGDHGLSADSEVSFRAESGGTLPSPLVANTTYYAIVVDEHRFSVSSTAGGAAIDLTTVGTRVVVVPRLPMNAAIQFASRIIDDKLPAHAKPQNDAEVPEILRITAAELAAWKLLARAGSESRSLGEMVDVAMKRIERWSQGIPLQGDHTLAHTNTAASSASLPVRNSRGWTKFGGL